MFASAFPYFEADAELGVLSGFFHSVIMMIELNMFSGSTSMIVIMGMVKMIMIIVMIDHDNHDDHDNRDDKDEYVHWLSISAVNEA